MPTDCLNVCSCPLISRDSALSMPSDNSSCRMCVDRYSAEQLYDVVSNVGEYEQFVPWCERSTVLERRDDTYMEAELEVGFKVFVER